MVAPPIYNAPPSRERRQAVNAPFREHSLRQPLFSAHFEHRITVLHKNTKRGATVLPTASGGKTRRHDVRSMMAIATASLAHTGRLKWTIRSTIRLISSGMQFCWFRVF
jgi:hypothetical protein